MNHQAAFTVDLDDWYHTPLVAGADFSHYPSVEDFFENWKKRYDYVTEPSFRLLELLKKHGIKATFFVIADMIERYPELMQALKASPHEIAHHSLHHTIPFHTKTKKITQSPEKWEEELIQAKALLENYFEKPIKGFRAPGAYFADWMIPILLRNGFEYDSSLVFNSVYNKTNLNLKQLPRTAYWLGKNALPVEAKAERILEIPWPNLKLGQFYLPGGGAFFFRVFGYQYFKYLLNQNLKLGNTVFYIHSLDISYEKFPLGNFSRRPFYWYGKGKPTEKNLEKLLIAFQEQFCTCESILKKEAS